MQFYHVLPHALAATVAPISYTGLTVIDNNTGTS